MGSPSGFWPVEANLDQIYEPASRLKKEAGASCDQGDSPEILDSTPWSSVLI
jgi:hypothetical protein